MKYYPDSATTSIDLNLSTANSLWTYTSSGLGCVTTEELFEELASREDACNDAIKETKKKLKSLSAELRKLKKNVEQAKLEKRKQDEEAHRLAKEQYEREYKKELEERDRLCAELKVMRKKRTAEKKKLNKVIEEFEAYQTDAEKKGKELQDQKEALQRREQKLNSDRREYAHAAIEQENAIAEREEALRNRKQNLEREEREFQAKLNQKNVKRVVPTGARKRNLDLYDE